MSKQYYLSSCLVALLLSACGGQPQVSETAPPESPPVTTPVAEPTEIPGDYTEILERAGRLLDEHQLLHAASLVEYASTGRLTAGEQAQYAVLQSRLTLIQGDASRALQQLEAGLPATAELTPQRYWQVSQWHSSLLRINGRNLDAAAEANRLLSRVTLQQQRRQLLAQIWRDLQNTPRSNLQRGLAHTKGNALGDATDSTWKGWLQLALIDARVGESPAVQEAEIQLWQQEYAEHPAAADLPGGLQLLPSLAASTPGHVALLLPLSNSLAVAGQAILDGYMAARFDANNNGWPEQQVSVYDIAEFPDINAAYEAAVAAGAELVIGPLSRGVLARWQPSQPPPVPLLSLNRFPHPVLDSQNIYQLSLAPADEARQLAEYAYAEGGRSALIIRPGGDWGDTVTEALLERWNELDGELVSTAMYNTREDYSTSIKNALALEDSEKRATVMRQLLAANLEFTPRRRQDIDTVFLLSARPSEARAIKPLIAFHYAADLPVYSTSHVFNGRRDPQRDRDLNDLRLLEIPWLLSNDNPVTASVDQNKPVESLSVMYALGADAFLMHWRLAQMHSDSHAAVRGHTGLLTLDEQGRFHRKLDRARISAGLPQALQN